MKMTSKSGCVCQPASLKATTTPHLGTASQVRSRDSRRGRAWSGWGSCPRVTTGPFYRPHRQSLPRKVLSGSKRGPVNMAFE